MKIGRHVKMLRELNGLTQDEMAEKLKMTTKGYTRIEHDLGSPNLPKIEKIAKIFDMTALEFLDFCENGASFYISSNNSQTSDNNGRNYYLFGKQGNELLLAELEKAEQTIQHKNELLAEKEREIQTLHELVAMLKKQGA